MRTIISTFTLLVITTIVYGQRSAILADDDLIFYYDFEELAASKINDLSSNNFDGNYENIKSTTAQGYWGKAFEFADADKSIVWIDYDDQHSIDEVTIMAWIYAETDGLDDQRMEILEKTPCYWINRRNGNREEKAAERGHIRGGVFCSEEENGNVVWRYLDSENPVPLKEWHHVAFVYDTEEMRIYIDGELSNSSQDVFPYIRKNEVPIAIGCRNMAVGDTPSPDFGAFWDGRLDEVILLGAALGDNDIQDYVKSVDPTDIPYTIERNEFTLYPNPSNGHFTLYTGQNDISGYVVNVVNALGQEVYSRSVMDNYFEIDMAGQQHTGVYVVQLINPRGEIASSQKMIIK